MKKPNVGTSVEKNQELTIQCLMASDPKMTRREAARRLLSVKDRWYIQTPEGEYLTWVMEVGQS